jgi:crotonobetainyl-CoA:carnitine CoA-transferase CaiB-like acyl-CoA transferase
VANRATLDHLLEEIFRQHPAADWMLRMNAAGIPCSVVRTFSEVLNDPQAKVREMFPTLDHPRAGRHKVTGAPVKFSHPHSRHRLAAPLLGQHTRPVLRELLMIEDAELEKLFASGVVLETTGG